jgi:hypothetical protein
MREKLFSIIIALAAILLLQQGITGFYLMDFQQSTCLEDSDCENEICCPVYGEDYGLCDIDKNCDPIYAATKEVASSQSSLSPTELKTEARATAFQQNYVAISLGIILAVIVLIVAYYERKHEKPKRRRKAKK